MTQVSVLFTESGTFICFHKRIFEAHHKKLKPLVLGDDLALVDFDDNYLVFHRRTPVEPDPLSEELRRISIRERRRARVQKADGHHLPEHLHILWEIQKGRCYFSDATLGERFEDKKFSVDHLIPLAGHVLKGTHWPTNLALVTLQVNSGKGSRLPRDYLDEVRRYKRYVPRPPAQRRRIDWLRSEKFGDFMRKHCSLNEDEWDPLRY